MTYYDRKKDSKKPTKETGGPVVKTGPPAGQNRTRNIEGSWRKTVQMHVLLKNKIEQITKQTLEESGYIGPHLRKQAAARV